MTGAWQRLCRAIAPAPLPRVSPGSLSESSIVCQPGVPRSRRRGPPEGAAMHHPACPDPGQHLPVGAGRAPVPPPLGEDTFYSWPRGAAGEPRARRVSIGRAGDDCSRTELCPGARAEPSERAGYLPRPLEPAAPTRRRDAHSKARIDGTSSPPAGLARRTGTHPCPRRSVDPTSAVPLLPPRRPAPCRIP